MYNILRWWKNSKNSFISNVVSQSPTFTWNYCTLSISSYTNLKVVEFRPPPLCSNEHQSELRIYRIRLKAVWRWEMKFMNFHIPSSHRWLCSCRTFSHFSWCCCCLAVSWDASRAQLPATSHVLIFTCKRKQWEKLKVCKSWTSEPSTNSLNAVTQQQKIYSLMSLTRARVCASETTTFEALNTEKRKKNL